jgi:RNA polymerase sigma factor (sigma-70 family)
VEASVVHHPGGIGRLPVTAPLLRLRSDDQLLAQFRAGNDEAFRVLHDRYRQRLFVYVRQMLSASTRQDAEDVMQDVFVRAYGGLRADSREMNVRAWLYRVAHNRCIDHLRRPTPPAAELYEVSRKPLHDPVEEAQRREDLSRLVQDIGRLPEQQRSALLMRELDGMSYADLAAALDVTVPAVKSLLVRARVGLVDAADARDAACAEIRADLMHSYDRGVKASSRARRHLRGCSGCAEYRNRLRGVRHSFAALSPVGFGPVAVIAKLLGAGGAGGGAAAGGTAVAGGGAAGGAMAATGATVTACKFAAVVCTAAITAGGAVEANHLAAKHPRPKPAAAKPRPAHPAAAPVTATVPASSPAPPVVHHLHPAVPLPAPAPAADPAPSAQPDRAPKPDPAATPDKPSSTPDKTDTTTPNSNDATTPNSGGSTAPVDTVPPSDSTTTGGATTSPTTTTADPSPGGNLATGSEDSAPPTQSTYSGGTGAATPPPAYEPHSSYPALQR